MTTNDSSRPASSDAGGPDASTPAGAEDGLSSLGWDDAWRHAFSEAVRQLATSDLAPARVVAEHRSRYVVSDGVGDRTAVVAGRLRHHSATDQASLPAVGDWVAVAGAAGDGTTTIHRVLERRSAFARKVAGDATIAQVVAANVDLALIATALPGDLSVRRLERYLTLAWESGAVPAVLLTKTDLSDDVPTAMAEAMTAAPGVDVFAVSSATGEGIDQLERHLAPGRTAVLLGSSGVGKSTLVNRLLGADRLRTAAVRDDGRGRHTTTHRELIRLANGALLIDTPGMRELQLWSADSGLEAAFADVESLAGRCRFRDCRHDSEPGCAVRDAVAAGTLGADRLDAWHKLRRELAHLARKQDELLAAEHRGRVKSVTQAARKWIRDKYRS